MPKNTILAHLWSNKWNDPERHKWKFALALALYQGHVFLRSRSNSVSTKTSHVGYKEQPQVHEWTVPLWSSLRIPHPCLYTELFSGTVQRKSKKSKNQEVQKVGNCVTLSITLYFQGRMAICAHFLMPTQETTEEHACLASSPISQTQCSQKTGCLPREVITQVPEVSRLSSDIKIMSFFTDACIDSGGNWKLAKEQVFK